MMMMTSKHNFYREHTSYISHTVLGVTQKESAKAFQGINTI